MFPFLEPVLIYGFAVCLGILLALLFGLGYGESSVLVMDAFLIGGFVGGWLVASQASGGLLPALIVSWSGNFYTGPNVFISVKVINTIVLFCPPGHRAR
ncbi:MAG: hypothetical protein ACOX2T_04295 [bacterium]